MKSRWDNTEDENECYEKLLCQFDRILFTVVVLKLMFLLVFQQGRKTIIKHKVPYRNLLNMNFSTFGRGKGFFIAHIFNYPLSFDVIHMESRFGVYAVEG